MQGNLKNVIKHVYNRVPTVSCLPPHLLPPEHCE